MGYRNYIASIPKREYNKIKKFTKLELNTYKGEINVDDDNNHVGPYEIGTELYELGKYVDFDPPKGSMKPFFKNKELHNYYNDDYELVLVTKEFLAYVINNYKEKVSKYYNKMIQPFYSDKDNLWKANDFLNSIKRDYTSPNLTENITFDFSKITQEELNALHDIIEHIRSFRTEWCKLTPYNLESGNEITTSWKYEYTIFELVKIYKQFNWKKDIMFYYGY